MHRRLCNQAFDRLREQLATATALCSEEQVLDLADGLHDALRRRRIGARPMAGNVLDEPPWFDRRA